MKGPRSKQEGSRENRWSMLQVSVSGCGTSAVFGLNLCLRGRIIEDGYPFFMPQSNMVSVRRFQALRILRKRSFPFQDACTLEYSSLRFYRHDRKNNLTLLRKPTLESGL
jgi:hypothetical protein